jgi:hypothetical protein
MMWRAICAAVLLPALAAAQNQNGEPVPTAVNPAAVTVKTGSMKPSPKLYREFTYFNQIRQGSDENVALELAASSFVTTSQSSVPAGIPLKLELEPAAGFTFGKVRYPKGYAEKFPFQPTPIHVRDISHAPLQFKLRANRGVALGEHTLKGTLTFQTVSRAGISALQTVNLEIPVRVVEHNAKVMKAPYPYTGLAKGWIVLMIVLLPVLIPLLLIYYPICGLAGPSRCPD